MSVVVASSLGPFHVPSAQNTICLAKMWSLRGLTACYSFSLRGRLLQERHERLLDSFEICAKNCPDKYVDEFRDGGVKQRLVLRPLETTLFLGVLVMRRSYLGRHTAMSSSLVLIVAMGGVGDLFAQAPQGAPGTPNLEEIVVTGSRIVRRDFTSQSPIVTIDQSVFTTRTNVGMEAALNQFPQFTVAGTQAQNSPAGTPFPQADAAPGAATLNLRGLGGNRSLVLFDGHRVQPINGQLLVDINTIPSAAIDRVEIITGGAAAVYGADAIAGVVNFIPKKNFQGVQINAQTGISAEGDGKETSFSGIMGTAFGDGRGSVMLGADYSKRKIDVVGVKTVMALVQELLLKHFS